MKTQLFALLLLFLTAPCMAQPRWNTPFETTTSWSSPRMSDLNGDGVKDVVFGGGGDNLVALPIQYGYMALNGINGELLWVVESQAQVFTSPCFVRITADETDDVVMGGRFGELKAIDGSTGDVIWEFFPYTSPIVASDSGWYNFYSCQPIPDQDGDDIMDILTANGGDASVPAGNPNRPPGNLMVLSGATGMPLAKAQVPDGAETYCSPLVATFGDDTLRVVYGTGGETLPGGLWRCKLSDIMDEDLSASQLLHASGSNGYVAPPSLGDLNGDGIYDIVANSYDNSIVAVDGATGLLLWEKAVLNAESNVTPALGYLNSDQVPDVVTTVGIGEWPDYSQFIRYIINGVDGSVIDSTVLDYMDFSSAVLVDVNADGYDELLTISTFETLSATNTTIYSAVLQLRDVVNGTIVYDTTLVGSSVIVTPTVDDMDNNGFLDIVLSYNNDSLSGFTYQSLNVARIELPFAAPASIAWSSYQGTYFSGIFDPTQGPVAVAEEGLPSEGSHHGVTWEEWMMQHLSESWNARVYNAVGGVVLHDLRGADGLKTRLGALAPGAYVIEFNLPDHSRKAFKVVRM